MSDDRCAMFIDGANLDSTMRGLQWTVDFDLLRKWADAKWNLIRPYYFSAILEDEFGHDHQKPRRDFLDFNGYTVISKPAKVFHNYSDNTREIKGNMDIEIAVSMQRLAYRGQLNEMILVSGDGDFRSLVEEVQNYAIKVTVLSTIQTRPRSCAEELRRQADQFVDLADMRFLEKKFEPRPALVENLEEAAS